MAKFKSGDVVALLFIKFNAVQDLLDIVGPANSVIAKQEKPSR